MTKFITLLPVLLLILCNALADTPPAANITQINSGAAQGVIVATPGQKVAPVSPCIGVLKSDGTSWTCGAATGGDVASVNGQTGVVVLDTGDISEGSNLYWTEARFNSSFSAKSTSNLSEGANLYYTNARVDTEFDARLATKSTTNLSEGSNLYYTAGRFDAALATKTTTNLAEGSNLYHTTARARSSVSASTPLSYNSTTGLFSIQQASTTQGGFLSAPDYTTFNNKLDASRFNYITNPDAEVDVAGWNLYDDTGRTDPAFVVDQDITYTSVLAGGAGNGATVSYVLGSSPYAEPPVVTCPTASSIQVAWYNGPTVLQNPTTSVLKAAVDAAPCTASIATATITGTASTRQYLTGTVTLSGGGDTSPVNGTSGTATGLTFTRNTSLPLVGTASFDLGKDALSRQGKGVSTDFTISSADKGNPLQISFYYSASAGFVLGNASDVKVFLYDVTNAVMLPLTRSVLSGPTSDTAYRYAAQFTASSTSVNYRLILHVTTTSASAWDLKLDSVTINSVLDATAATQVPKLVIPTQPITGAVTDHMAVMWLDGNSAWQPATMASGVESTNLWGFATNLVGLTADITIFGALNGFSVGPFAGYNQYVDNTAGGVSPLPSPFTDTGVAMGKGISADTIMVRPTPFRRLITSKGGLLTNTGLNNGSGDVNVPGGITGQFLRYNTALANGFAPFTPLATAPIIYTAATSTWSCTTASDVAAGCITAANHALFTAKAPTASPTFTGTPTLPTGTIAVTQAAGNSTTAVATTAFVTTADNLKANLASPTFTGTPTLPTGTIATTQSAGNSTTAVATTAFVTTADNLKANIAAPTLTGDVTLSTGNLLISTIGKGPQVKTGTNAKIGTAVLVGGTVTVANTSVNANSRIFLTSNTDGGTPGFLRVSAKTNGTSFVITSSSGTDTSTVAWYIVESIP